MGRGCTMDEWVHFERLPEEGRVPNSSYWYVHCRHCVRGFEQKQLVNPPAKLTGRRSAMKAHLKVCPLYATQYKMEQRALAAAAAAAAATASVDAVDAAVAAATTTSTDALDAAAVTPAAPTTPTLVGTVTIKTQSGEKRKRRGEDVEASGPRGGRGKHCMMEEWEHFIRLQDEGYIGKSNFFFAVCRHCQAAYDEAPEDKKTMLAPEKMVGRREKMRKHLMHCPYFKGDLPSLERRTQVRSTGPNAFLPLPTPDGIKMVPASALASVAAIEAAGLGQPGGGAGIVVGTDVEGAQPSARLALDEWQYFTRLQRKKDSAYYFARCNFCQQAFDNAPEALKSSMTPTVVMGRKSNMQTHLAKCPYVPKDAVLFNKAVLAGGAFAAVGRDDYAVKRLKLAGGQLDTNGASLHQILVEFLLQHRLPFEWVDSLSAKKLLRLAAAGAQVNANFVPSSEELRGPILDELLRMELHPDVDKLKQVVSLPPPAVPAAGESATEEPAVPSTTLLPVVIKVSIAKPVVEGALPDVECVLGGNGVAVPLQYITAEKESVDEDSLITGISSGVSGLSYYHGLEVARYLSSQIRRVRDDYEIAAGVVMVPESPIMTRAVGLLRGQSPNTVFVGSLEDMVAFCLLKALENPLIAQVVAEVTALARTPEIEAALAANGFAAHDEADWTAFASVAHELLSERMTAFHATIDTKVDRTSLFRVATLFRTLAVVNSDLVIGGRVSLADTLTHLATLFTAAEGFDDVQLALEVVWHACEQPLYLLAHALHPHMRLRGVASTELTKLSVLSDLGVSYFTQFFGRKPLSLRGDVTSYLHVSQPTFTESFIAEFPLVDDYFRYLRDNFAELAALMQLLQSFSVNNAATPEKASTAKATQRGSLKTDYSEDEQKKLSLLEERWGVEVAAYRVEPTGNGAEGADVEMTEEERVEEAQEAAGSSASVTAKWLVKLNAVLASRMVDFSEWEAKFARGVSALHESEDAASDATEASALGVTDVALPSQAEDDVVAYAATPLTSQRAKKVRLAQLFGSTETTTV